MFDIRRILESFSYEIQILIDGFVGLLYGYPVTASLIKNVTPWMKAHNVTDPRIAFYYASKQTTRCGVMLMFMPSFQNECSRYEYAAENIWILSSNFFTYQVFFYFTFLGSLLEFTYVILMYKEIKITLKIFLDFIITIANIIVQYIYYTRVEGKHALIRDDLLASFRQVESSMLVFLFLMWIKFFVYLKLTKTFGYVIKIIEIMIKELINFFLIFSIIILAFTLICYDLLDESHYKFSTFALSIRSLLEITYGQIFFDGFTQNEVLASVIITIFSVLSMIIMLNLLVAILSNAYSTINERSNLENANILYENYLIRKPDKFHSSLISFPPILNTLSLITAPFIIFKKSSTLNEWVLRIGFSPLVVIYFGIYIAFSITIILPLCWLKYILSICLNVVFRKKTLDSVGLLFLWIFLGYFKLLLLFFTNDIPLFFQSIFYRSLNKDSLDEISIEEIKLIIKTAKKLYEYNDYSNHKDFCAAIRDDLTDLNKKTRKKSKMTDPGYDSSSSPDNRKMQNKIFNYYAGKTMGGRNEDPAALIIPTKEVNKNMENKILQDVEIDKMEVFSLIKQFVGVDGLIMLGRMIQLLEFMSYGKKFTLDEISKKQRDNLVNRIQIVDIVAVEKAVLGILSENLKFNELFVEVQKNINEKKEKTEMEKKKFAAKDETNFNFNEMLLEENSEKSSESSKFDLNT